MSKVKVFNEVLVISYLWYSLPLVLLTKFIVMDIARVRFCLTRYTGTHIPLQNVVILLVTCRRYDQVVTKARNLTNQEIKCNK